MLSASPCASADWRMAQFPAKARPVQSWRAHVGTTTDWSLRVSTKLGVPGEEWDGGRGQPPSMPLRSCEVTGCRATRPCPRPHWASACQRLRARAPWAWLLSSPCPAAAGPLTQWVRAPVPWPEPWAPGLLSSFPTVCSKMSTRVQGTPCGARTLEAGPAAGREHLHGAAWEVLTVYHWPGERLPGSAGAQAGQCRRNVPQTPPQHLSQQRAGVLDGAREQTFQTGWASGRS